MDMNMRDEDGKRHPELENLVSTIHSRAIYSLLDELSLLKFFCKTSPICGIIY